MMRNTNKQTVKHYLTTSAHFNSLAEKDQNGIYFLEDTNEIFRADTSYSTSVSFVSELPQQPALGRIYVNESTLETNVWDGINWNMMSPKIENLLSDDVEANHLVTGEAIKAYIKKIIIEGGAASETDNVALSRELRVMGQSIGSYKDGDVINMNEDLTTILSKLLAKQIPPTYSRPGYSLSPGSSNVESGTNVNPNITGSYSKNDGGTLTTYSLDRILNGVSTPLVVNATNITPYAQDPIMVPDGGLLKFTGRVNYSAGPIKNDNLGNAYPTGSITAGSLSQTLTYTGQRKTFYGKDNTKTTAVINSSEVRALPLNKLNPSNGLALSIPISAGDTRVTIAYPNNLRDLTSVVSSALNLDVKATFVKTIVDVEGANGYDPIQYKVFTYIPAIPFTSNDTYNVTI